MGPDVTVKAVDQMSTSTPEQVLEAIVEGINTGNLDALLPLYESEAAFATEPGTLARDAAGVREALNGFISTGEPVRLEARNADVLRRQADGNWRFVIDNPWGVD
jgi:ketosteroid isomerase-like protein